MSEDKPPEPGQVQDPDAVTIGVLGETVAVADVLEFPLKPRKEPDREMVLKVVDKRYFGVCQHTRFLYDEEKADVECADCHEKLNPMWVIKELSSIEHRLHQRYLDLRAAVDTLSPKLRQKCEHCGKMTKIKSAASSTELGKRRLELEYGKS